MSISNSGNINVGSGAAVALTGGTSSTAAIIRLTSGTVTANEIINSDFAGNVTMTMSGGSATGRITLGSGNDTVTVSGGTMTLTNGTSAFGGGTDSMTLSGGTLIVGDASNGSKGVTVTGLETFTVNANTTMGLYLSRTASVFDTAMTLSGRVNVNAALGQDPTALHVYLPSGYSISDQNYFTLLSATALVPNSVFDLADLASQVRIFAADGTEYVGFVELGVTSTNAIPTALTLRWSNMAVVNNTASTMSCALASTTLTCTGGNASELNSGINARRLFQDITSLQDGVHTGNLTVTINNVTDTTINSDGTGHGVRIDGARTGSRVSGSLTVNHQTTGTKRTVQVSHRGQAGLYVKGRSSVTVTNGANVLFATNAGRHESSLYGIHAIATGTGDLTVTNNFATTIGFSAACTANCGANHRGIAASHIGTGDIDIVNAGVIRVTNTVNAVGMVGILAELPSSSAAASVSIVNTGTIEARDIAVNVVGGSGKTATIRFNGGSRVSSLMAYWSGQFGGNSTVGIASNAVVTGGITGGTGNESVSVFANGSWTINYSSSFGGGTDSITNRGIMAIGSMSQVSRYIGITGLETFTLAANSTLRLYLDSLFGKVDISGTVTFNGSSDRDAPILELFLPAGYTSGSRSAFTLIDASAIVLQSTLTFSELARRLVVRSHDGTVYDGDFTLSRATGGQLQLAWGTIGEALNCRLVGSAITCSGGSASSFEFVGGFDLDDIFRKISSLSSGVFTGDLTVNFGSSTASLAATVNTAGTGHGIELDGTVTDSRVTGSMTVNNQTAPATKRDIQVRGANKAALYVRSSAGVTINNAASLVFKPRSGNTHGSGLRGIEAISAGTGNVSINNNTGTTIGFSSSCLKQLRNRASGYFCQ